MPRDQIVMFAPSPVNIRYLQGNDADQFAECPKTIIIAERNRNDMLQCTQCPATFGHWLVDPRTSEATDHYWRMHMKETRNV